jgi:hypothetical protein
MELRRVALRPAGRLLRRLVEERPAAPRPPVAALAGAVVAGQGESLHARRRRRRAAGSGSSLDLEAAACQGIRRGRLLQAPERTLLAAVLRPPALLPERLHVVPGQRPIPPRANCHAHGALAQSTNRSQEQSRAEQSKTLRTFVVVAENRRVPASHQRPHLQGRSRDAYGCG